MPGVQKLKGHGADDRAALFEGAFDFVGFHPIAR